jgi:excinuclease ABC subunit C
MTKDQFEKNKLPDTPGVYFFLGENKKILYIGKATSLRSRVRSYFSADLKEKRSELIENMVAEAETIDYTITDSVLEALILETNLIRTHKPRFNTKSKDDKSYNHLIITNEEWPRLLVVRGRDVSEKFLKEEIKYEFGPFPSGTLLRDALKIIRKLFRFYDTNEPVGAERTKIARGKIDFNRQIGLYPDPNQREEYLRTIRHLKLLFEGKKQQIIKELEKDMMRAAKQEAFEAANKLKKQIFSLKHIEDVALIKNENNNLRAGESLRVEAYDIAHMAGQDMVGVMVVVQNGESLKSEYRKFKIKTLKQANDPAALKEVLKRRFTHPEWPNPGLIVVDGNEIQINAAREILQEQGISIPVAAVVKDDRHKAAGILAAPELLIKYRYDILLANAEAHRFAIGFYRNLARKRMRPD